METHTPDKPVHSFRDFVVHLLMISLGVLMALGAELTRWAATRPRWTIASSTKYSSVCRWHWAESLLSNSVIPADGFSPSGGICGQPAFMPVPANRRSLGCARDDKVKKSG
jgi:hypothetical protein